MEDENCGREDQKKTLIVPSHPAGIHHIVVIRERLAGDCVDGVQAKDQ